MVRKLWFKYTMFGTLVLFLMNALAVAFQDNKENESSCNCGMNSDGLVSYSEVKEQTLPATGATINVDGRKFGGVNVKGWDSDQIKVRACIMTSATTEEAARELAGQIHIETVGSQIHAVGPQTSEKQHWAVSFEVFVPRRSNLSLQTYFGGIHIADVNGDIEFTAVHGGISLRNLAGNVHGRTTNGGLSAILSGNRWEGQGMDVKTTNGGVHLTLPENYSAHLETGTVNGAMRVDFPVTVQGRIGKNLSFDLGSGGATVRAMTTNGSVSIKRGQAAE